jgi:hypothetical protein
LIEGVGIGPHGLIKVGDGDWNDAIALDLGIFARSNIIASGIAPIVPAGPFVIDTALLKLDVSTSSVRGEYRAFNPGTIVLRVAIPAGASVDRVTVHGEPIAEQTESGDVLIPIAFEPGQRVAFESRWR